MVSVQQSQGQTIARLIGAFALGAGAFLPWVQNVPPGDRLRYLIYAPDMPTGAGQFSLVLVGVGIGIALMTLLFGNGKKTAFVAILGGIAALAIATEFLWTFSSTFGRFEPAIGVYVTISAGVLLVISGSVESLSLNRGILDAVRQ